MILAGPFLDVLSQKVDEIRLGRDPVPSGGSLVEDILRSLAGQVRKIVLFLLIQGLLLLVYLIPVIGQIAGAPLQAGVTFFFLAWEFWDFPMERRKMNFRAKREFLLRHKAQALSFGAVCFLYMLVPVLNFIMMPASVAGATVLVSDLLGESSGARAT
ncbi:MAG: EI24 domain-containing protein [Deltaproteobacteria bacterium]|nr:EI24 domain-containing protein [Deltaproteobacteria bacterium]